MIDFLVVGAGPAGLSAAIEGRTLGLNVVLIDNQATPGGQIYRNVQDETKDLILGKDYTVGRDLVARFSISGTKYIPNARVWRVEEGGVCYTGPDGTFEIKARHVLLATGAMERPAPTLGWTLPGVMTAGAAQIMLKSSGLAAKEAVFVGSGPLLYLIVAQYIRAGIPLKAVLDTTPRQNHINALRHAAGALSGLGYLLKGAGMLREIRRADVRIQKVSDYSLHGQNKLERIDYRVNGVAKSIKCDKAFVHQGVIPAINATASTGCSHIWNDRQAAWQPETDPFCRTAESWLRIAGDVAGIQGAKSAAYSGAIAALAVAFDQYRLDEHQFQSKVRPLLFQRKQDTAIRPFLDTLYRPLSHFLAPVDDAVTVCRCELVTRGQIKDAVREGCPGPNQMKAFTRSGMGPCQGRMCGPVVSTVMADLSGLPAQNIGHYNIRSPFSPVTVGDLATIQR